MKTPHKHSEVIKAWADGAEIEVYDEYADEWVTSAKYPDTTPTFSNDRKYRVKAEPIIEKKFIFAEHFEQNQYYIEADIWPENGNLFGAKIIQVTLTDGKVTAVELLYPAVTS